MKKHLLIVLTVFIFMFTSINYIYREVCVEDSSKEIVSTTKIEKIEKSEKIKTKTNKEMKTIVENTNVAPSAILTDNLEHKSTERIENELDLLARVIWSEAGSDWLTDEHQRAVASVVINRVNDSRFPNTIREVIYQEGQYGCVYNGMIYQTPNQRAYDNARYVLENGVTTPTNVVWQAKSKQGNGVWKYIQGHYFCY